MKLLLVLLGVVTFAAANQEMRATLFNTDAHINMLNRMPKTWKAGSNFHPSKPMSYFKTLMGVYNVNGEAQFMHSLLPQKLMGENIKLPTNFDARQQWPMCKSIGDIRDQSNCGSCWAFGAAEAISDRICIASKGAQQFNISAENLLTCCKSCGYGCDGGMPAVAWSYYVHVGLVTGGPYGSHQGCQPYTVKPCDHHEASQNGKCASKIKTPKCVDECEQGYPTCYNNDKHYGSSSYSVKGVEDIMKELFTKGPVEAAFNVYADFFTYKSGVYSHVAGSYIGEHAVKILGYGVEGGVDYWLAANSWNEEWGDKGFFKIKRGNNECGIEGQIVAGEPRI